MIVTVGTATAVTFAVAVFVPAVIVTVAVWFVLSIDVASPSTFVVAMTGESVPWSVLNATGTPASPLLLTSSTVATIVAVPPSCDTLEGLAVATTVVAAAAPIMIDTPVPAVPVVPPAGGVPPDVPDVEAEPENALTTAVPETDPALKITVTLPSVVVASAGVTLPREVVKVTTVPFWTGHPPLSSTLAVT